MIAILTGAANTPVATSCGGVERRGNCWLILERRVKGCQHCGLGCVAAWQPTRFCPIAALDAVTCVTKRSPNELFRWGPFDGSNQRDLFLAQTDQANCADD